jgi:hypothetical protein
MHRSLRTGELAEVGQPKAIPVYVWEALQDCLRLKPQARPRAERLLAAFEAFLAKK